MYDLGPALEAQTVDPGTNLLVSGPPMSGVRRLAFEILAHGIHKNEAALVITTRFGAHRVLADLETLVDTEDAALGVVDCVTRGQDQAHADDQRVSYVTSPAALTQIGIEFSKFVSEFDTRGFEQVRVVFDALSTMLPYVSTESVFKFVHVLAGQITDADGLGMGVIEPAASDEETRRTIEELFDGQLTVAADGTAGIQF
jgi:KaiC/GvpD/RAD55 family RecA-like ATPase